MSFLLSVGLLPYIVHSIEECKSKVLGEENWKKKLA